MVFSATVSAETRLGIINLRQRPLGHGTTYFRGPTQQTLAEASTLLHDLQFRLRFPWYLQRV